MSQIRIEKIWFHVICAVHTDMKNSDLSHIRKNKNQIWATFDTKSEQSV